jgi:hypothetical protein
MSSYFHTPLEENYLLQSQTGIEGEYDDIQQFIMKKYSKLYLLPDNANFIFSHMKNNTYFIDDILINMSNEFQNRIHVFQCANEGLYNNYLFDKGVKVEDKIRFENKDIFYIEYYECDYFGHYGACQIVDNILYIFDSMMNPEPRITNDEDYSLEFVHIVRNESKIPIKKIVKDCHYTGYSMEVTGGCLDVENYYIKSTNQDWIKDMKYLGVDNQNQFCYMWAILYILYKSKNKSFPELLTNVCKNKIIPLVVIKTFIFNILKLMIPKCTYLQKYLTPFFFAHFFTFTTNAIEYDLDINNEKSIFNDKNNKFEICSINLINKEIKSFADIIN